MIKMRTDKNNKKTININKCIYCGSTQQLTNEHVFPFALGGNLILSNACCEPCRNITSKCERNPLHDNWIEARACLGYPSRRKTLDNRVFPLKAILKDGTKTTLNLTKKEILGITQFLDLAIPGCFEPKLYKTGSRCNGIFNYGFGVSLDEFTNKYNIKSFSFEVNHKKNYFEIMLAKIGFCLTVATWGPDCLKENFVLSSILLKKDDVGRWVGCDHEGKIIPLLGIQPGANVGKVFAWSPGNSGKNFAIVRLKFFAGTDTPEYIVVVGELKKIT